MLGLALFNPGGPMVKPKARGGKKPKAKPKPKVKPRAPVQQPGGPAAGLRPPAPRGRRPKPRKARQPRPRPGVTQGAWAPA